MTLAALIVDLATETLPTVSILSALAALMLAVGRAYRWQWGQIVTASDRVAAELAELRVEIDQWRDRALTAESRVVRLEAHMLAAGVDIPGLDHTD